MGRLGGPEWLLIILLVVLLFGAKRLPDVARGVGRSLRIFKSETKGLIDDPAVEGQQAPPQVSSGTTPPAPVVEAQQRNETPPVQ